MENAAAEVRRSLPGENRLQGPAGCHQSRNVKACLMYSVPDGRRMPACKAFSKREQRVKKFRLFANALEEKAVRNVLPQLHLEAEKARK